MEEEGGSRKRKEDGGSGGEAEGKVGKTTEISPAILDADGEVEMEEEAVAAVMKWLEEEMDSAALPHSPSSPSYRQETSFVTINGNEESCGPSFSSSASTVMASVDTNSGVCCVPYFLGCPSSGHAEWPSVVVPFILGRELEERSAAAPVVVATDRCAAAAEEEEGEVKVEWVARAVGANEATLKVEENQV